MASSLITHVSKTRVSSVLNRDVKQFGKQFLMDGQDETCWNSDQGSPQYVHLEFSAPVEVREVCIQFQGGFVGKDCWLEARQQQMTQGEGDNSSSSAAPAMVKVADFYPEDINAVQKFPVELSAPTTAVRIVFSTSTDFFGRIIVYKMDVLGQVS